MPILVGAFGNFLIPLMIGARDMAFPVLNMLSFWVALPAAIIMLYGFTVPGGHAAAGWTSYAPLSADPVYTGVEWGQNLWIISLIILGFSSMMGAINYITTLINMRAPGMTFFRLPLVIWSLFIVAILVLLAIPVLTSALAMLLFDRLFGTTFFLPAGGGEPLLWQHLFWFFGHPEVYILILPGMGIASDILSTFSRKPIFGYRSMVYAMIGIGFLSWIVWGHHMFQSGMNPALGVSFTITTMVIAVPSAIKTFNWLGTIWGGTIRFTVPMLNALAFVAMFVIGGLSGIFMASTPVDIFIHDTYYIVAHIHYVVFGGSVFGIFAGIYYWFPKMFGRMMNDSLGKIHFWATFIFFNCTFFPMHILGVGGHMRRIYNPTQYEFLLPLQPINVFITVSAILLGLSQIPFVINFFWSLFAGRRAERNPWQANTLEWVAPTPTPHGNFEAIPTVYRGPYEYSSPEVREDYLPQDRPLAAGARGSH
jgi:cytochrome c oxidase subunit 1